MSYALGDRIQYISKRSRHGLIPKGAMGTVIDYHGAANRVIIRWDEGAAKLSQSSFDQSSTVIKAIAQAV